MSRLLPPKAGDRFDNRFPNRSTDGGGATEQTATPKTYGDSVESRMRRPMQSPAGMKGRRIDR